MNEQRMKTLLLRDKDFIKSLYDSQSSARSKTILNFASDSKINTLIKLLHMITNGQIKVKKEHFDTLSPQQLKFIQKHFESKNALKKLLSDD